MELQPTVDRDTNACERNRIAGKGSHHLADRGEAAGALAASRDVTAIMCETRYRWRQTVQHDRAALQSRRRFSDPVKPYR
jgi:hypothetical protein